MPSRTLNIRVRGPDRHQLNLNRISRGGVDGLPRRDVVSWDGRSGTGAGGEWVAVFGCGGIGLSDVNIASAM
jgi:hypothetical protein